MIPENLKKFSIILASNSPRRQQLLREMGIPFTVRTKEVDEVFPDGMLNDEIAIYLCELKALAFTPDEIGEDDLIIAADTIVCLQGVVMNKPGDRSHAVDMLKRLSGKKHEVITGVCLRSKSKMKSFSVTTQVYFRELTGAEIAYYVDTYRPFDKAGSYGIQEWIGLTGISRIEGSYFNVVGLPADILYEYLKDF